MHRKVATDVRSLISFRQALCLEGEEVLSAGKYFQKFYRAGILGPMIYDERPWGSFTVLDEGATYKVKRIEVLPLKRLSYQKHAKRAEHWMIVAGEAKVTLDGSEVTLAVGQTIDIPVGAAHRIENTGSEKMIFIEIQRGSYLGEDDIQRLQDDYGRQA